MAINGDDCRSKSGENFIAQSEIGKRLLVKRNLQDKTMIYECLQTSLALSLIHNTNIATTGKQWCCLLENVPPLPSFLVIMLRPPESMPLPAMMAPSEGEI